MPRKKLGKKKYASSSSDDTDSGFDDGVLSDSSEEKTIIKRSDEKTSKQHKSSYTEKTTKNEVSRKKYIEEVVEKIIIRKRKCIVLIKNTKKNKKDKSSDQSSDIDDETSDNEIINHPSDDDDDNEQPFRPVNRRQKRYCQKIAFNNKAIEIIKNDDGNDIREIIFEDICDGISRGMYGNYQVYIMKCNGFINVTKLCQLFAELGGPGPKKQFKDWSRLQCYNDIMNAASARTGIAVNDLLYVKKGGRADIAGTYIHPILILHIAIWASPVFSIETAVIINEYNARTERNKYRAQIEEKDDIIDQLAEKVIAIEQELKNIEDMAGIR